MARVTGSVASRNRRKKVLKLAKGYFGSKHKLYKTAKEQVMHSLKYAYRDRKQNKREMRKLWITRINAACRMNEISYSKFISGLNKASAVFDYTKLRWMNTEYIRKTSLEDFTNMAFKFSQLEGTALEGAWSKIAAILHQRMELLSEIPEKIAFLVKLPEFELDLFKIEVDSFK